MKETYLEYGDRKFKSYELNTVVVGTGAAGFNSADRLFSEGQQDIAIVTENIYSGTSRNTGSDKQTYYKLTLSGDDPDSVRDMAQTLFEGQCVDGDIALCEAALSAQGFLKLVELGVPFPRGRYGEYIGYKTDHDPRRRATSIGPYTSKSMTECLEKAVKEKKIKIFDKMQVVKILADSKKVLGLLCLDLSAVNDKNSRYIIFKCKNVVWATGGPAGIYMNSVYPLSQSGASGLAFEAGVVGKNLTEWQYGLASTHPRWNVSGTYMQVLPKFISTDKDGNDKKEFLNDFFEDKSEMLTKIFLKGYQWPFDVRKAMNGSSIIDILVYKETLKGRKVFLDFRKNPLDEDIDFKSLTLEAYEYLNKAGACFGTPLERLLYMNKPAVDFYKDKGVDLEKEPLEIALCAQHNNGGLSINSWWQTNLEGFFAVGEVAGSHGVYRPGGSALNAGQVGSTRAALYIANKCRGNETDDEEFIEATKQNVKKILKLEEAVLSECEDNAREKLKVAQTRMSNVGSAIRNKVEIEKALNEVKTELNNISDNIKTTPKNLSITFRLRDILLCQYVYLSSMADYIENGGKSRGSALYSDEDGEKPDNRLEDIFKFLLDGGKKSEVIQETLLKEGKVSFHWRKVRKIPEDDDFFENVWRDFRETKCIY